MSLKINGWKGIVKWAAAAVAAILVLVFFIKVATFESAYYNEKEGSERAVVETGKEEEPAPSTIADLIEVEPTEEEIYVYTVPDEYPRYLSIDDLGIYNRRVRQMGINDTGELATPTNIFDVGWYESSSVPGGGGTVLIDGHNGGPTASGVFKYLPDLPIGAYITIENGAGYKFYYVVRENKEVSLDDADSYMVTAMRSPEPGMESITLITCAGDWSDLRGTYLSRQFVRAVLAGVEAPAVE